MKMFDIASRMAGFLAFKVGLEESKIDTVRFGLEIVLGEIIKCAILLTAANLLGVLPGAIFAMVSIGLFRLVSGGAHCEDYWRCLVFGLLTFLGFGKLGVYLEPYLSSLVLIKIVLAETFLMALFALIWAPGEVPNRRIEASEKVRLKNLSLFFLVVWTGITVFLIIPYSIPAAVAGVLAIFVQTVSFTPAGYWAIDRFDLILSRIMGERRCSHA